MMLISNGTSIRQRDPQYSYNRLFMAASQLQSAGGNCIVQMTTNLPDRSLTGWLY